MCTPSQYTYDCHTLWVYSDVFVVVVSCSMNTIGLCFKTGHYYIIKKWFYLKSALNITTVYFVLITTVVLKCWFKVKEAVLRFRLARVHIQVYHGGGGGRLLGEDVKANRKCTPGRWVYMTPVGVQMVTPVSRQQWLWGFPTGVVGCGSTREWRNIEPVSCPMQRIKWQLGSQEGTLLKQIQSTAFSLSLVSHLHSREWNQNMLLQRWVRG